MDENLAIIKTQENTPVNQDNSTGLVVGASFQADSGFNYIVGMRQFGDLTITESVGQGTAVTYLNRISVYNGEKELIIDKQVEKGIYYSRETVRQLVLEELLNMLEQAARKQGRKYDRLKARTAIDEKLKDAYYEKSYSSVLKWAETIGIELTNL